MNFCTVTEKNTPPPIQSYRRMLFNENKFPISNNGFRLVSTKILIVFLFVKTVQ